MVTYSLKKFQDLSLEQLYGIMALRQEVFIVEQDCPYLDADGKDHLSLHVMGIDEAGILQTYARLVPKGISYPQYNSIGRVITSLSYRGKGEGKRLMQYSIMQMRKLFPDEKTKISAQVYAIPFYSAIGFEETGKRYDEDGIPHVAMLLQNNYIITHKKEKN